MKKLFLFLAMASTTMFVSCGSDDSDNTTTPVEEATAITLTANATAVEVGTAVTLTVKNNLVPAVDVTSTSTFTVNNVALTGNVFTPTEAGSFSIVAKNGDLTSAAVVITVTAVAETPEMNNIFVNGENFEVNNSATVFWGGWAEDPNATEATHGLWSMVVISGSGDFVEALMDPTSVSQYIDVEFVVELDSEGGVVMPTVANATFLDIYQVQAGGEEIALDSQEGGSLTFGSELPEAVDMPFAFAATADYNSGSSLEVNYDGNWAGVFDATAARPASSAKNIKKSLKNTKALSRSQVLKNKTKFFTSLNK